MCVGWDFLFLKVCKGFYIFLMLYDIILLLIFIYKILYL
jgi:hypothetical protein